MAIVLPELQIRLHQNPWESSLGNEKLLQILQAAGLSLQHSLALLMRTVRTADGQDSYAAVILDPTRPRNQVTIAQRVMATVLLGPNAEQFIPNAAAKADAHDRHGVPNGELISKDNHCLNDGDFAWGNSASYRGAIAGGSGLSAEHDQELANMLLARVVSAVHSARREWLVEARKQPEGQGWFNSEDTPSEEYQLVQSLPFLTTSTN